MRNVNVVRRGSWLTTDERPERRVQRVTWPARVAQPEPTALTGLGVARQDPRIFSPLPRTLGYLARVRKALDI